MVKEYKIIEIDGKPYAVDNPEYKKEISEKKYQLLLARSGIPKFYWNIEWEDYIGMLSREDMEEVKFISRNILNPKIKDINFYFWSTENSTQKSAILSNFGKECIKSGLKVTFINFGIFVNYLLKNQGFNHNEEVLTFMKKLKNSDMILLDDSFSPDKGLLWNRRESNSMIISEIDSFFRTYIYNEKRIAITSNISPDVIEENYGTSLAQLIYRNFKDYQFLDSIGKKRNERMSDMTSLINQGDEQDV